MCVHVRSASTQPWADGHIRLNAVWILNQATCWALLIPFAWLSRSMWKRKGRGNHVTTRQNLCLSLPLYIQESVAFLWMADSQVRFSPLLMSHQPVRTLQLPTKPSIPSLPAIQTPVSPDRSGPAARTAVFCHVLDSLSLENLFLHCYSMC